MSRLIQAVFYTLLAVSLVSCNFPGSQPQESGPDPVATALPSIEPSPTFTPSPSPTPTPQPAARVTLGDQALFYGDWEMALEEYQTALESSPDPDVQSAARLGIGRTHFMAGEYGQAQEVLEDLIVDESAFTYLPEASFFLAQTFEAQEQYGEAVEAYDRYLEYRPGVIDSAVQARRGDALFNIGDYEAAIDAYQAAIQAPHIDQGEELEIAIAQAYELSGDLATALVVYQDIYDQTTNDYVKAQMDLRIGGLHTALGNEEEAQAAYLDAVQNYPLSYDSYLALLTLVEGGVPVDEFQRGLVDYYARQYAVAVAAFDRYLQTDPEDADRALYYKGLASSGLGEHQAAIDLWEEIIKSYPESEFWDEAWEEKADTMWYQLDKYLPASQVLEDFVKAAPTHARAAELLFQAASVAERGAKLERAVKLWQQTAEDYPTSEYAQRALFLAGITRYRLADYAAAYNFFQDALVQSTELGDRAAAFFWSGKSRQALKDADGAKADFQQAAALDPTGYYSERAADLLEGIEPFTPPQEYNLSIDLQSEWEEAEGWVITVFDLPEDTDLSGPGSLESDLRFQRGNELWHLGLYDEARIEFEDLRLSIESDPASTFRLANHLIDLGLYRSGILAARRVLTLAGMDDAASLSAPAYFNHVRFGPYFKDLIIQASQTYNFHPLFLTSVVRQESLFEGFVRSSAGARGLMQIIPATGEEIAANLGWPLNYTAEDLYRPVINITLGSDYLNRQRGFLDGDIYAALAAYNGGPGNAAAWKALVPPDPDLFLEVIRYEETRNYIKGIYEIFNIYRELYDLKT